MKLPVIDTQDIRFIPVSADGKSIQVRIWSVVQDNYGFLWFGTSDGLYRYDGYSLNRYRNGRHQLNSLSSDLITSLYKDRTGILWIGTTNEGLYSLDPAQDTLTHYQHERSDSRTLIDDGIRSIYQDHSGALWIGTRNGLDRLDRATGTFAHYRYIPDDTGSLSSPVVHCIFEDRAGNLWVGTGRGLNKLERATGRFARFVHETGNPYSLGHDYVGSILEDHSGVLWLTSPFGNGLSSLDVNTGKFTRYSFHAEELGSQSIVGANFIFEDRDGVLWVCTVDRGLLKLDRDRASFRRYSRDTDNPTSLIHDSPQIMFEDAEGTMWVGTQIGLCRFQRKPPAFVNYRHEAGNPNSLCNNVIRSVQVDSKGFLWIGTEDGLNRLDRKTGQFTLYRHDPKNTHSLSYSKVAAISEDPSGALWFGTYGGGLDLFDRATAQFFHYRHNGRDPHSLSTDAVLSLLLDRQGVLWVGTQDGGLNRLDPGTQQFTTYRTDTDLIYVIFQDRAGILWFGGQEGGLSRLDPKTGQITVYRHSSLNAGSLAGNRVYAICEDRAGALWIGTEKGLNRLDRNRGTFTIFTTNDGLPDDAINGILEDARGRLWLATGDGLSRFDPQTKTFRNYSESDGLPSNSLSPNFAESSTRTANGEMIIGSSTGVTTFYPDRVSDNPYVPPVVLTDFRLFNKPVDLGSHSPLNQPVWATGSLKLTHAQGIFTFEFAALSYAAPENNRYRYRLEELEKEWNEVDSRHRLATYTNLPAGTYTFRVEGSNNDGVWNDKGVTLPITILPLWWATWSFRSMAGLSIACLAFAAYRARITGLKKGAARLEAIVSQRTAELSERNRELEIANVAAEAANRAKTTFLANMTHELRTPLHAILGFSGLLREGNVSPKQRSDLDIISGSGEHLLKLINDLLDVAKIEAGHGELEIAPCDLAVLVRDTAEMMRVRAEAKNLTLRTVQSAEFPRYVRIDALKLREILINLLGNAIKCTERGSVTLRLDAAPADEAGRVLLKFRVEDTGIGIAPEHQALIFDAFVQIGDSSAQKGTGLGLTITRQFVALLGGTIHVESALGQGSHFCVELPVELLRESEVIRPAAGPQRFVLDAGQPEYRILIVDDDEQSRLLLERLLQNAGFGVRLAAGGAEGIEIFRNWRPHFIWMDIVLAGIDGVETARQIRALEGGRDVKIAAVSASVLAGEQSAILAAGMDDFVGKPYRPGEIFGCMARHLGARFHVTEATPASNAEPAPSLRPEALAALPPELRAELRHAMICLEAERVQVIIGRVSERDAALGSALSYYADRLAYTPILRALETGMRNSHSESV